MSEHLALRSSVGSRSSALPSHHLPQDLVLRNPDPLASDWIRRLHLIPNPPPPPRPPPLPRRAPPPSHQDAVSTDESRTPPPPLPQSVGFGPFRWSMRPLRGATVPAWDATAVSGNSGGCSQPMLSPFFRLPAPPPVTPVKNIHDIAQVSPLIRLGSSSGGYTGLSSTRMVDGGDHHGPWFAGRAAGDAYPSHALDMAPIRTLNDLHDRQHGVMPQHFARRDPSSGSQHDEPFSYWNMGRFRRNTTTSSISPIGIDSVPSNFSNKRNADSTSFLPLKLRKLSSHI